DHEIDLTPFLEGYGNEEGGNPAFHPALMLKPWLYGYCTGTVSSRRVARATYEDVAFRYLAADQHPTFTPLARFRLRNLANLDRLFLEVLRLCREAGLVGMTRVALDGTKVRANASKHKAMSHGRMVEKEKQVDEELHRSIQEFLRKGIEVDAEEDRLFGKENNPYLREMPEGWKTKKERLEKIRAARKRLEEREKGMAKAAGKEGGPSAAHEPNGEGMKRSGQGMILDLMGARNGTFAVPGGRRRALPGTGAVTGG
ncbi:transposase IS4 family protein, partial [mine drainage metagenome]